VKLSLFFMHPLPSRLTRKKAIKLEVDLLLEAFQIGLKAVTNASDLHSLPSAWSLHEKSDDQIDS
jgi:hypothetical protein